MSQLSPQSPQPVSAGLLATMSGRNTPFSMFSDNTSMINISQSSDNRNQVDQMKKRASSNKTFLNIKIGGSTLCISYQGKKTNNITDLRDFEFHAPRLELRNQVESYYELLMQVKKEYMSVVVQHTGALVKEKFRQLHSRKAWSKSSFGPDWEARRLLIEMDRRVDEDMAASAHNIISEREGTPGSVAMQQRGFSDSKDNTGSGYLQPLDQYRIPSVQVSEPILEDASGSASAQAAGNHSMALDGTIDDAASIHSAKGKAPLSKHMILDPRKLMGKRVPNLSRNPTVRSNTAEPAVGSGSQQVSQPTSIPSAGFRGPTYSAMHLDMVPAAPFALSMPGSGSGSAGEAGNERRPSAAALQDSAKQKDGSSSSSDQQQQ
ncbi:Protein SABRE [Kickxella alabastrina]|nr:Protein SABRE [Kickxella alabastrina]